MIKIMDIAFENFNNKVLFISEFYNSMKGKNN